MLQRANRIVPFSFPRDHGQHPDFRIEWWYLSGRLRSNDKSNWAFHFSIFRRAFEKWSHLALVGLAIGIRSVRGIALFKRSFASMLETRNRNRIPVDGYVGHLSVTNLDENDFVFFERGGTSLLKVAGARDDRLDVWVKDWRLWEEMGVTHLIAQREDFSLDLEMVALKPPILNGSQGLSMKGQEPGEASYHYSLVPLKTAGTLKWRGISHQTVGSSFIDREYGTSILPNTIRGWDWFGLILENNHELMISLIRNTDGTIANTSSGTLVLPDGSWRCFSAEDLHVQVVDMWTSPVTGAHYPIHWVVRIDPMDLYLEIRAVIKAHELVSATSTTVNYWEGPVSVSGNMLGRPVEGLGHVELVGYAESVGGKF